jgi:hypothetical protein
VHHLFQTFQVAVMHIGFYERRIGPHVRISQTSSPASFR